jgi:hypothetical protein
MLKTGKVILFEPWNMGDAVMAFAIALQDPARFSVACNSKWHKLLRSAAHGMAAPELFSVDLGYISRNKAGFLQFGNLSRVPGNCEVLSIRGDARDYFAARHMFPQSRIRVNGWLSFLAKRVALFDIPFAKGWLPVRNRYNAWASIADVKWSTIERFYQQKRPTENGRSVIIHIGAQWRSRQYPYVAELAALMKKDSHVRIVAGLRDMLPDGVEEKCVCRLEDGGLVDAFSSSTHAIVNDSGPMHLAALLHCRTLVISRQSAIREWLPPTVLAIESNQAPSGYRPDLAAYRSDVISNGWPSPIEVLNHQNYSLIL